MGIKLERRQIEEFFNYYFEDAYRQSSSEYEFENYFRNKAYYKDIDLDSEIINSMFSDILKFNKREFKLRKENDRLKEEKEKLEYKLREELAKIKNHMERERKRNEDIIEEFQIKERRTMLKFEEEIRKREQQRKEEEERREQIEEKRRQEEDRRREIEKRERMEERAKFQSQLDQERKIREEENRIREAEFQNILRAEREKFQQIMKNK